MNTLCIALTVTCLAALIPPAHAQFVKGNEAVRFLPDGTKVVETPPLPRRALFRPCKAENLACTPSGWLMVETADGIQECTEFYARPGTCRPSTYGKEKHYRLWIVKIRGQWMQCRRPDINSVCVSTKALPLNEIQ